MAFALPRYSLPEFEKALLAVSPAALDRRAVEALHAHYMELTRWNERLALIGPGTAGEVFGRHYGEALAALPLVPAPARTAIDLGSGAGFPGLVLAAARPELAMTLVEARQKKWAFLLAAARQAALPCQVLNARVATPLPAGLPDRFDLVTARALKLEPDILEALASRLTPSGCILLWVGGRDPILPPSLSRGRNLPLPGGAHRRVLELRPEREPGRA
ncbi:MAG TPA: RsmG family class I SAM-dependent methyltransferase [Thermoanaerobaculia bacterium]|nr:RsmG family class I SAM-dependent methyltransferase [Thermoanaerobaculia bacterium]